MQINLREKPFYLDDEAIAWVEQTRERLSLEDKVGQLFCVLYRQGTQEEIDRIGRVLKPGGAMYRSISMERAVRLTNQLQAQSDLPLLLAANLEKGGNGIVQEGTLMASPMEVAATDQELMAQRLGQVCAEEATAVGANWAFAPIVDIDTNFRNPITNVRTYGADPERVLRMGRAYLKAVQERGMVGCVKHFPGDGQDERDQHLVSSVNDLSVEDWDQTYGRIYRQCIEDGALSVMVGHILQPAYTRFFHPDIEDGAMLPASLSPELVTGLLRGRLHFQGLVVTDATTMAGFTLAMSRREAVPAVIQAGCDMFLFCRNLEEDYQFMLDGVREGRLSKERLEEAVTRILATKAAIGLHHGAPVISLEEARKKIGCPIYQQWARECADQAITLVKEETGVLPLTTEKYRRILCYPIEAAGGVSQYAVREGACRQVFDLLREQGFEVDVYQPSQGMEGDTPPMREVVERYDLVLYVANLATKSNQTVVRIEWAQPMGANCMHYLHDVPTVFVSLENPYHLLDVPRVRTYINTYSANPAALASLVDKLTGKSPFLGKSPVDAFCGKWDAHL